MVLGLIFFANSRQGGRVFHVGKDIDQSLSSIVKSIAQNISTTLWRKIIYSAKYQV